MPRDDTSSASAPATGDGAALLPPGTAARGGVTPPRRPLLRRPGASRYLLEAWGLQRAPATLAKLAVTGGGPSFHKAGRWPLYDPDDLDVWAYGLIGKALVSTSQHEAA